MRLGSTPVQLIEALGQRRKEVLGGDLALFHQLHQLGGRNPHALRCGLQRSRKSLAQLAAKLLRLNNSFARHLCKRVERIGRLGAALASLAHGCGHRIKNGASSLPFNGSAACGCGQTKEGFAHFGDIGANAGCHSTNKFELLASLDGIAAHCCQTSAQSLHLRSCGHHLAESESRGHCPAHLSQQSRQIGDTATHLVGGRCAVLMSSAQFARALCSLIGCSRFDTQRIRVVLCSPELVGLRRVERPDRGEFFTARRCSLINCCGFCALGLRDQAQLVGFNLPQRILRTRRSSFITTGLRSLK